MSCIQSAALLFDFLFMVQRQLSAEMPVEELADGLYVLLGLDVLHYHRRLALGLSCRLSSDCRDELLVSGAPSLAINYDAVKHH